MCNFLAVIKVPPSTLSRYQPTAEAGTITCHRNMQMEEMAEAMVSPEAEDSKIRMLFIYNMNKRPTGNCSMASNAAKGKRRQWF